MLKLTFLSFFAAVAALAQTQVTSTTLATNTPVNLLSGRYATEKLVLIAPSAGTTTFKFYDTSGTDTNRVTYAAPTYTTYSTNYTVVITNAEGVVFTNTFSGLYRQAATVAQATNERPRILTVMVPASGTREIEFKRILGNGLTVQADRAGSVELEYNENP